jgi:hypothetical protein
MAAAYLQALMWSYTRNIAHAKKAVQILDAWSRTLKKHTNRNADLMVAWAGQMFVRAAEIIRHTTPKGTWSKKAIKRFEKMLMKKYLRHITKGKPIYTGGNWELSMAEAVMNIGVFCDNQKVWDRGVALWKRRTPAYIYVKSDGKQPVRPWAPKGKKITNKQLLKFWYGQKKLVNGLTQETCRDLGHTNMGLGGMINAAETAHIQGLDLYGLEKKRIVAALEFHAPFFHGAAAPSWLCGGKLNIPGPLVTYEIAYNHYALRKKIKMPKTKALLEKVRPTGGAVISAVETLTHGLTGK